MSTSSLEEVLADLNQRITDLDDSISERGRELEKTLNKIMEGFEKFEEAWSSCWFKSYADLYFNGLEKPPISARIDPQRANMLGIHPGWMRLNTSNIEKAIEKDFEISLSELREEVHDRIKTISEFRDYLCVELSLIRGQTTFVNEAKELEDLENFEWGVHTSDYIRYRKPSSYAGELADLQMGLAIPPHIRCQANIVHLLTKITSGLDFIKKAKKLIRKIQILKNLSQEQPETLSGIENIVQICNSFHTVARQLRERHSNRETLTIDDEYDVQDLFHALLKIFFNDVRPEDSVPGYAGASSRVDFLIPQEKIVVEIKKTRNGLGAKEIGSQLLIDIARYQSHPNCRNLVCFVYDPEAKIGNPKGLENDLNNLSNEKINIIVLIRPA